MCKLAVRSASVYDVRGIAANMRREDREELVLAGHTDIEKALCDVIRMSDESYTVIAETEALGMFGVAKDKEGNGICWAFGTYKMEDHWYAFARSSKRRFTEFFGKYPKVYNLVDIRYSRCIKWLEWLGFTQYVAIEAGPHKAAFVPMVREA